MYVNGEIVKRKDAVHVNDVRDLVLHIIADAPPPNWVKVEHPRSIEKVVALLIPGILPSTLALPPLPTSATSNPNVPLSIPLPPESNTPIPFIANTYSHACPTRAPGDQTRMYSVLSEFFQCQVTGEERARRQAMRACMPQRAFDNMPSLYLLSLKEMIENDYPIPSYMADVFEKGPHWVETPQASEESILLLPTEKRQSKIYAIDCEMCLTEDGKELTRVCMIDYESGIVVYDKLVKPPKPVIDYMTRWSGITEAVLASATTTLAEVQAQIVPILAPKNGPTSILVGHSLESDLRALRICHSRCIDTAIIYHHPRGRPLKPGLAWLTKKWAGREIQTRGESGHDPEEDARACVDLLRMKLRNGPGFGEYKTDLESIFERMARASGRGGPGSVRSAVVDHGNPGAMHGARANSNVPCTSDQEVLEGLLEAIPAHEFSFGRFTGIADALGWLTPKTTAAETPVVPITPAEPSPMVLANAQAMLNNQLITLYASLPPRTAFIIFTGHSDPRRMASLNARKSAFESAIRGGKNAEDMDKADWWTASDGRELEEEVEKAKRGLLFLGVK
ncbi:ribonuclease H-like protein [Rhizopogon salebrosus TDB-379]|nr:ribonuclease H-like protein [Rhizopogon salebrosus TDB-379]